MNAIFATETAAALAFVASIEMGMSPEEAHELVYGTPCEPAYVPAPADYSKCGRSPEEPAHMLTFGGVYVNVNLMGDAF